MLPESSKQEKEIKIHLTQKALSNYYRAKDERREIFPKVNKKEEETKEEKKVIQGAPKAPEITWSFYLNDLSLVDDEGIEISGTKWEFCGEKFASDLIGYKGNALTIEPLTKEAQLINLDDINLHIDLKEIAVFKTEWLGRHAVTYMGKGIKSPFFLIEKK